MYKKIILILTLIFSVTSCANTFDSVKRGITGEKAKSTDEFFVRKKDPLILPPDYENLPIPGEEIIDEEEVSFFEKNSEISIEADSSKSSSVEDSVLKKIRSK